MFRHRAVYLHLVVERIIAGGKNNSAVLLLFACSEGLLILSSGMKPIDNDVMFLFLGQW
jgi:hypothetical protein